MSASLSHNFDCSQRNPNFIALSLRVFTAISLSGRYQQRSDGTPYDIDAWIAPVFDTDGSIIAMLPPFGISVRKLSSNASLEASSEDGGPGNPQVESPMISNNILAIIITNTGCAWKTLTSTTPSARSSS